MPRRDPSTARRIWMSVRLDKAFGPRRKRRPRKGDEPEREPVEPTRPNPLSGGAAAELEFDD